MISRSPITNPSGAAGYYSQQSAAAEYYSGEAVPSSWVGKGAEMLGLAGRVSEKALTAVLEGRLVDATGPRELGRTKVDKETGERSRDHRAGWDFTISASKSMSLAALAIPDARLNATATAAHRAGVEASLQFFEREGGRYREGGETKKGALVIATHEHVLSRAGDSQLHTHALLANICLDSEGRAHSLAERDIFRLRRAADYIYHSTVAQHMERAGHPMEFTREGAAELVGISPGQRMEFSARRQQLLAELAARGIDPSQASAEQRNILNLSTRQDKEFLESREANKERWADEVQAAGIATPTQDKAIAAEARQVDGEAQARRAVEQAMKHLGEREAVFTRIDLLTQSARFNQGKASPEQVEAAITSKERSGELLRDAGGNRYTTSAELSRVQAIGQALEAGKGAHEAVMTGPQFDAALQKFERVKDDDLRASQLLKQEKLLGRQIGANELPGFDASREKFALSPEQRAAARMILVGDDQFQAVQGLAGTGKTTLLSFVREAAEAQGWQIVGHSNGASQAQTLEAESGIASTTTARHLIEAGRELAKSDAPPAQPRRELRVMDEASMADSREFAKAVQTTQAQGARTVFLGDKLQHQSVNAGRAFEDAQRSLKSAELGEASIRRQRTDHMKEAVHNILQRDFKSALDKLEKVEVRSVQAAVLEAHKGDKASLRHALREARAEDNKTLIADMGKKYAALPPEKRAETLVITATNADRRAITQAVRTELNLNGKGHDAHTLRAVDMTPQEAKRAENYDKGHLVELQKDAGPLAKGTLLKVERIDQRANVLHCTDHQGKPHTLHPREHKLSAYTPERAEFSPGDSIKFTQNHRLPSTSGPGPEVKNGQRAEVTKVTPEALTLRIDGQKNEVSIPLRDEFTAHKIAHSYCFTSQGAQGMTKDTPWVHHNPDRGVHGDRASYVNITRGRDHAVIFTTSTEQLYKQAGATIQKTSALDIAAEAPERQAERTREAQRVR